MRYNKTDVAVGDVVKSDINVQLGLIEDAINDTLSRVGDLPNSMVSDLDMNSKRILNLPDAVTPQEPATYSQLLNGASFTASENKEYDTLALWQADTSSEAGDIVVIKERADAKFDVITGTGSADGANITYVAYNSTNWVAES